MKGDRAFLRAEEAADRALRLLKEAELRLETSDERLRSSGLLLSRRHKLDKDEKPPKEG